MPSIKQEKNYVGKAGIFAALMALAYFVFSFLGGETEATPPATADPIEQESAPKTSPIGATSTQTKSDVKDLKYLPKANGGEVVRHQYMILSYNEKHEQANWVAYELTKEQVKEGGAARDEAFAPDAAITTGSATPYDYRGSGFDRGHLCPAADRDFSKEAMAETFLMSNMSPQIPSFNRGIWRELEETVRDWAYKYKDLYIVTGPILTKKPIGVTGKSEVSIPASFYKIIYDKTNRKGIAFLIPNDASDIPLTDFAVSIDKAEKVCGIDFFPDLWDDDNNIENECDLKHFRFDEKRFKKRVSEWNNN